MKHYQTGFILFCRSLPCSFIRLLYVIILIIMAANAIRFRASGSSSNTATLPKAKLIVFDLDFTLWPFWVDTHVDPPFEKHANGKVYDSNQKEVKYYLEVPQVLEDLHSQGYILGIASRTSCRVEAKDLLRLFDWDRFFQYAEIYPGSKANHFKQIHKKSGFSYDDMIFFDDEHRNIVDVRNLGVLCIFVDNGVGKSLVQNALEQFAKRSRRNLLSGASF